MLHVSDDVCCDWKVELVSVNLNVKRVFDARQNLASALHSCLSDSDASARSSRVLSRVPFSWTKFRIKLSGVGLYRNFISEHESDPWSFRDRFLLGLRRTREKTFHARLTSHHPLTCSRVSRVSHVRDSPTCVSARLGTRSDYDEDRPDRPTWWITHAFAPNDSYGCKRHETLAATLSTDR